MKCFLRLLLFLSVCLFSFGAYANPIDTLYTNYKTLSDKDKSAYLASLPSTKKTLLFPHITTEVEELKKAAERFNDFDAINNLKKFEGEVYYHQQKYNLAIPLLVSLFNKSEKLSLVDSLVVLSEIALSYARIKDLKSAFQYKKIIKNIKNRNPDVSPWLFVGGESIYLEIGLFEKGIQEMRTDFNKIRPKYKDDYYVANYYNNIGVYFNRWEKPDSAIYNFTKARKMVSAMSDEYKNSSDKLFFLGLIDGNIAQALMLKHEYKKAIPLLKSDIRSSINSKKNTNAAISFNELAKCYISIKNFEQAKISLDSALILLGDMDEVDILLYNKKLKAELLSLCNKKDEALRAYRDYILLKDSVVDIEKNRQLISEQVVYEVQEKVEQIERQAKMLEEEEKNLKRRTYEKNGFLIGVIALSIVIIVSLIALKTANKQRKELLEKNKEISLKNTIIEHSLSEKENLIKEVHHRVKNNLQIISSLLNLQISKTHNNEAKEILEECRQRIASIALTHQFLFKTDSMITIEMGGYLTSLVNEIKKIYATVGTSIVVETNFEKVNLGVDFALPIGLIVNELVSNAFKHAFVKDKGQIMVSFNSAENKTYKLLVSDNGKGISKKIMDNKEYNLGLELVEVLASQLSASTSTNINGGTSFSFSFTTNSNHLNA